MNLKTKIYELDSAMIISGANDKNIKVIEKYFKVDISIRGNEIITNTTNEKIIEKLEELFSILINIVKKDVYINERDIIYLLKLQEENKLYLSEELYDNRVFIGKDFFGKSIYAKTLKQKKYIEEINKKDLVFGIGPAGTGKTFIAVVYAVKALKDNKLKKIILTRPAVEAGESLGYLPGDLKEKVDPYLRPLYDVLHLMLGVEQTETLIQKGIIEIAPLAYMRGRTLDNACVILDEAQNTTLKQMKMFLTRLGFFSKMIITGDITQIDLPKGQKSGLEQVHQILKDIKDISFIEFEKIDVIRHPLVQLILERYEKYEN